MDLVADTCFTLGKKQQEILDLLEYHLKKRDEIIERERNKKDELVREKDELSKEKDAIIEHERREKDALMQQLLLYTQQSNK